MAIPSEMRALRQWVVCTETDKCPYQTNGLRASVNDPTTWTSYDEAVECIESGKFTYIGFVLSETDGIIGIDIDCGVDPNGLLNEYACEVISKINSYTELSKNKRGVHIFVKGDISRQGIIAPKEHCGEIYKSGKFMIMTSESLIDNLIDNQDGLNEVINAYYIGYKEYKAPIYKKEPVKSDKGISFKEDYPDVVEGQRHMSLLSYGCQLLKQGMEQGQVYKSLLAMNSKKCKPSLERKEVDSIMQSVLRYKDE